MKDFIEDKVEEALEKTSRLSHENGHSYSFRRVVTKTLKEAIQHGRDEEWKRQARKGKK